MGMMKKIGFNFLMCLCLTWPVVFFLAGALVWGESESTAGIFYIFGCIWLFLNLVLSILFGTLFNLFGYGFGGGGNTPCAGCRVVLSIVVVVTCVVSNFTGPFASWKLGLHLALDGPVIRNISLAESVDTMYDGVAGFYFTEGQAYRNPTCYGRSFDVICSQNTCTTIYYVVVPVRVLHDEFDKQIYVFLAGDQENDGDWLPPHQTNPFNGVRILSGTREFYNEAVLDAMKNCSFCSYDEDQCAHPNARILQQPGDPQEYLDHLGATGVPLMVFALLPLPFILLFFLCNIIALCLKPCYRRRRAAIFRQQNIQQGNMNRPPSPARSTPRGEEREEWVCPQCTLVNTGSHCLACQCAAPIKTPTPPLPLPIDWSLADEDQPPLQERDMNCVMDSSHEKCMVALPCGHISRCEECARTNYSVCDVCEQPVLSIHRIYT